MFMLLKTGGGKYVWTKHAHEKMRHYRLTESRIKRIIRHPSRVEEGVLSGAVACMQPAEGKKYSEIWAMYLIAREQSPFDSSALKGNPAFSRLIAGDEKIKVITAWRYPGKSPERDPVPEEILREIAGLI